MKQNLVSEKMEHSFERKTSKLNFSEGVAMFFGTEKMSEAAKTLIKRRALSGNLSTGDMSKSVIHKWPCPEFDLNGGGG